MFVVPQEDVRFRGEMFDPENVQLEISESIKEDRKAFLINEYGAKINDEILNTIHT